MMNNPHDRRVPCPYCGSARGEACRDGQGDYVNWNHAVRISDAMQLDPVRLLERLLSVEARLEALERRTPHDRAPTHEAKENDK